VKRSLLRADIQVTVASSAAMTPAFGDRSHGGRTAVTLIHATPIESVGDHQEYDQCHYDGHKQHRVTNLRVRGSCLGIS
jgi:hypothetical protein